MSPCHRLVSPRRGGGSIFVPSLVWFGGSGHCWCNNGWVWEGEWPDWGSSSTGMGHGAGCALNGDKNAQTCSAVAAGWDSPRVHQELRDTPVPKTSRLWGSCWVLPGCAAAPVLVPGRCLPGSSQLSIDLLSRPKEGEEEVSVVCLGSLVPPVLLGGEQKGAEHPETSSCPPGHAAPYIFTYRSQFKPQRFSHGSVFCVSTCREAASWGQCEAVPPPGGLVMLRGPLFGEPFGGFPAAGPPRGTFQPLASFRAVNIRHLHGFTQSPRLSLPLGGPGAHPQPLPGK